MLIDGGCDDGVGHNRQFNYEPGADGLILFYTNGAMVVLDNAVYDSKPEARAPLLGGKVWQEQSFLQFPG